MYPCALRLEAGDTLKKFADDHGIPDRLRADLAPEITGKHKEFQAQVKRQKINLTFSEKGRSNQNYAAEAEIGHLKRRFCQKMVSKRVPKRVWDYGLVNQAGIMSRISRGDTGRTGVEEVTGQTPDISEWLDFDFMIESGGWTRNTPQQRTRILYLGAGWEYLTRLAVACATGY